MTGDYVGGHPEMPLHPYEATDDGTCAACDRFIVTSERHTPTVGRDALIGRVSCAACDWTDEHHETFMEHIARLAKETP